MRFISLTHRAFIVVGIGLPCLLYSARSQSNDTLPAHASHTDTLTISGSGDTVLTLHAQFVVEGSDTVRVGTLLLVPAVDYLLDARSGTLKLSTDRLAAILQHPGPRLIVAHYLALPFTFKKEYAHREPVGQRDTATGKTIQVAQPASKFSFDDLFGSNLQKSGSIVRGISVGTNQDMSLNSGFRMQMSGMLTGGLQLIAALTDENTPIQPEGTTQTLQEIDKVFVELRGSDLDATLGDFTLGLSGTEFGVLNRKLQGGTGRVSYRTGVMDGEVMIAGAVSRGKFATNQFQGIDGVQGPYLLSGQNNERSIMPS